MIIEDAFFKLLSEYPDLAALVGSRIYPMLAPQDADFPLIIYQRLGTERNYDMSGETGGMKLKMQLSCWYVGLDNYLNVKALANTILNALSNTRGEEMRMAEAFAEARNLTIQRIAIDDEADEFVESPGLAARELVGVRLDTTINLSL